MAEEEATESQSTEIEYNDQIRNHLKLTDLRSFNKLQTVFDSAQKSSKQGVSNANRLKEEINLRQKSFAEELDRTKMKSREAQKSFQDQIWPVLLTALDPMHTPPAQNRTAPPSVTSRSVFQEDQKLYKDCEKLVFEALKLTTLVKKSNKVSIAPSRIPALRASLEKDKVVVLSSIHAARELAMRDVLKRFGKERDIVTKSRPMTDVQEKQGSALLDMGANNAVNVTDDLTLGELAASLAEAMSKLEDLTP